ncbi:MAG: DUF4352 domain-containing protein [Bryobacterales bacterium]|nr:DUF4352 domain-containing protein [Bryobacterales bacterium]
MNRISLRPAPLPMMGVCFLLCLLILAGCRSRAEQEPVSRMGELVVAGPLRYTVFDTEWKTQIGEGDNAHFPKNRYLIIHLSVTNSGGSLTQIPTMQLETADGNSTAEITEPLGVAGWVGILRQLRPADTLQGNVVFDVPMSAYRLRVGSSADAIDEKTALIDIPIQYAPAAMPAPAPPLDTPPR